MQTHIESDDPLAIRLLNRFFPGQSAISIPIEGNMKSGQCYANVIDYIKEHSGSMQLGWLLTIEPNMYIEATHHAVWRDNSGRLVDITDAAFSEMRNLHSTFVLDNNTPSPTDYWHPSIPSKFIILTRSMKVKKYVEVTQYLVIIKSKLRQIAKNEGCELMRLPDGSIGMAVSAAHDHPIRRLYAEVQTLERQKIRLRSELDQKAT